MVTNPGIPFGQYEVADFVNRTWSTSTEQDSTKEANPLMGRIIYDIMGAQDQGASYQFGANTADNNNKSALQKNWGYYTPQVNNASMYSLISITTTKITLTMLTAHSCAVDTIGDHEWQNPPECGNHKLDENLFHMNVMMNV